MEKQNNNREWIVQTAGRTGFSVPTIQKLVELCIFQLKNSDYKTYVEEMISCLQAPQMWFSLRMNPVRAHQLPDCNIRQELTTNFGSESLDIISNLFFLRVKGPFALKKQAREITVDKFAAESIMTGANLYIPGFIRPLPKFQKNFLFSIYGPNQTHIANGMTQVSHKEVLEMKKGLGIQTTESLYQIPRYRDSEFYVNGFISDHSFGPFLACNLLMEYYSEEKQSTIFDVCSAPGHKTCTLSEIGFSKYGKFPSILSIDRSTKRLDVLYNDIKRLGLDNIQVIPKRIEKLSTSHPEFLNKADLLLFDPPCSALGTRPKLSITHTEEGYRSFFLLQRRLLKEIDPFLKKNGILLFTTCTLTLLENEGIASILMRKMGYELLDGHALLPKVLKPLGISEMQNELLPGIARNEDMLQKLSIEDSQHKEDLDRYHTIDTENAKKLIRVNPMGKYSTGYFIALLRKKSA